MPDVPDLVIGGQLKVGSGVCPPIGEGDHKINGSAGFEGPVVVGAPLRYPTCYANLMVGPLSNADPDVVPPFAPGMLIGGLHNPYSLSVAGDAAIFWNLDVWGQIQAGIDVRGLLPPNKAVTAGIANPAPGNARFNGPPSPAAPNRDEALMGSPSLKKFNESNPLKS